MSHAILAPSSAARRKQCPGSRRMAELFPTEPTPQSIEGDFAHAILAAFLRGEVPPAGATDEMLDGAELFLDHVNSKNLLSVSHAVEEWVDCSIINFTCADPCISPTSSTSDYDFAAKSRLPRSIAIVCL